MKKHLLLLCFCLLPFVAFSYERSPLYNNPIQLPTTKNDFLPVIFLVRDVNGEALQVGATYRIISPFWGAAGGDVYLGPSPNTDATCPDGVFCYISDRGPRGTPLTFTKFNYTGSSSSSSSSGIHVTEDINIQFDNATSKLCVNNTTWRVGDFDVFQGARLLETGTIGSWFKIVKVPLEEPIFRDTYHLLYCPGPLVCPSCPVDECQAVGVVLQDGKRRLALVRDEPLRVQFGKV